MFKLIPVTCITRSEVWWMMNGDGSGICHQSKISEAMNGDIYDTTFPLEERQWNQDSLVGKR